MHGPAAAAGLTATQLAQLAPASAPDTDEVPAATATASATARGANAAGGAASVQGAPGSSAAAAQITAEQPQGVQHQDIGQYFEGLVGSAYMPNTYLCYRYPDDCTCQMRGQQGGSQPSSTWELLQLMPGVAGL